VSGLAIRVVAGAGEGSEHGRRGLGAPAEMIEDFLDYHRIFDARDDLDRGEMGTFHFFDQPCTEYSLVTRPADRPAADVHTDV
jgi:hypothetical protein